MQPYSPLRAYPAALVADEGRVLALVGLGEGVPLHLLGQAERGHHLATGHDRHPEERLPVAPPAPRTGHESAAVSRSDPRSRVARGVQDASQYRLAATFGTPP